MGNLKDLTGQQFGRLKIIRRDTERKANCAYWICECVCNKIKSIISFSLTSGLTKSCGCLQREICANRTGDKAWHWRGGKGKLGGYITIHSPEHPNATLSKKVFEHRLVMEQTLGRYLTKEEIVHHRNGIKTDNRIENLELWHTPHPCGQRVEDKVAHALEILKKYAPDLLA